MRKNWRWAALAAAVAALVAVPSLVQGLPAGDAPGRPGDLLRRIRASADVAWSGYGESRGALVLPDAAQLGDLPALLAGTTRVRAWWRGPQDTRLDVLSLVGETDTTTDSTGTWTYSSADRRAVRVDGSLPVALPTAGDLLAPVLARRLAGTPGLRLAALPARRVAGRSAGGLRLLPRDAAATTVDHVDIWADPGSGLALRVDVVAKGQPAPSLTSLLLDLTLATPASARTQFTAAPGTTITTADAPDLASRLDQVFRYVLPPSLAGLRRTDPVRALSGGGIGTYGQGFASFVVVPVPRGVARGLVQQLRGQAGEVTTPLLKGLLVEAGRRVYVLIGLVPTELLKRVADELRHTPPPLRFDT